MYIETSSPRSLGDNFPLAYDGSACLGKGGIDSIQFYYHMYGNSIGTLRVKDAAGTVLWTKSGNQGTAWTSVDVVIDGPSFKIEGVRGGSYTGDIAIDDVNIRCWKPKTYGFEIIYPSSVWTTSPPPGTYAWTRKSGSTSSSSTGPSSAKSGSYYYYTEVSSPRSTGDKFELTLHGSDACGPNPIGSISFWYSMIGGTIGTLNVKTASGTTAWTKSGAVGSTWQQGTRVPVNSASVTFEGIRGVGYTGDIAIDEVTVLSCGSPLVCGDANGDGAVTLSDVLAVQKHIIGLRTIATTDPNYKAADVNGDGKISLTDTQEIQQQVMGLKTLCCPGLSSACTPPPSPPGCSATTPKGQWIQQSISGTWVPADWNGGRQWTFTGESCTATCTAHGKTCSNADGDAAYLATARDADCLMSVQAMALNGNPKCTATQTLGWSDLPLVIVKTWKSDGSPDSVVCAQGGYNNVWRPYDCSKTYAHSQYFGERLCFCSG